MLSLTMYVCEEVLPGIEDHASQQHQQVAVVSRNGSGCPIAPSCKLARRPEIFTHNCIFFFHFFAFFVQFIPARLTTTRSKKMAMQSIWMAVGSLSLALVPTVAARRRRRHTQQSQAARILADRRIIDTAKYHSARSLMVGAHRLDCADFGCSLALDTENERLSLVCLRDDLYDERIYRPQDLISVRLDEQVSSNRQPACTRLDLVVLVDDPRRPEWRIGLLDVPQVVSSPTYRARRL